MSTNRTRKLFMYVVKTVAAGKNQGLGHGAGHVLRVYNMGRAIGKKLSANMKILEPALLLHDIVRPNDPARERQHAALSGRHAKKILPRFGYTRKEIKGIVHAISAHSRSGGREEPKTLEAKIVYDADKLDGLGAFGIARARALCGARGYDQKQTARWYLARIMDVAKNRPLYTQYGKRIAKSKLKTSLAFCRKVLGKEYDNIMAEAFGGKPVRL